MTTFVRSPQFRSQRIRIPGRTFPYAPDHGFIVPQPKAIVEASSTVRRNDKMSVQVEVVARR